LVLRKLLDSFNNAVAGLVYAVQTQRNMRIHMIAALLVFGFGFYIRLDTSELLIICFTVTLVIMAELFNTAIEATVDLYTREQHPLARIAKNVAAGAVLITALNSLVVAYVIFYPRLKDFSFSTVPQVQAVPLSVTLTALLLVMALVTLGKGLTSKGDYVKGGMPSGHTAVAFAGCTALAFLTNSALMTGIAVIIALLVAHSRVDADVHSLSEVIAGALLGILVTMVIFKLAGW
jgi:diacylglycerol kinase (ATP)